MHQFCELQGMHRSYISTVAIPAFVTCMVTGFELPSVNGSSSPSARTENLWRTACGRMRWV
jgi:hypothetical protein